MKIDVVQKGYYEVYDNNNNFVSKHTSYRVALETAVNIGGGYVMQPKISVKVENEIIKDTIKPDAPSIINITQQ